MKGIIIVLMLSCIAFLNANPAPLVNITGVSQRDDASRKVDIYYNISHTMPLTMIKGKDNVMCDEWVVSQSESPKINVAQQGREGGWTMDIPSFLFSSQSMNTLYFECLTKIKEFLKRKKYEK